MKNLEYNIFSKNPIHFLDKKLIDEQNNNYIIKKGENFNVYKNEVFYQAIKSCIDLCYFLNINNIKEIKK
jgi:hypothetical protein